MSGKQSQNHGFVFENEIRTRVFGLSSVANDTAKHDIPKEQNKFCPNENISIKMTGKDDIACGDILRFFDYDFDEINTLIVGRYAQKGTEKLVYNVCEITYDKAMHAWLFGTVSREELVEYVDMVKSLKHGQVSKTTRANVLDRKKKIETAHGMKIQISPKIDSGKQRRVQCRIKSISAIAECMPGNVIIYFDGNIRGAQIKTAIPSAKRTRVSKRLLG